MLADEIFGGAVPKQYIPAIEKGIVEASERGFLAGQYSRRRLGVVLYDGSYHDVDSSEMAFNAGSLAFKKAMEVARPVLLNPS